MKTCLRASLFFGGKGKIFFDKTLCSSEKLSKAFFDFKGFGNRRK